MGKFDKTRNKNIDIIKGTGIILMVLCHAGFQFNGVISLFHMPIFFIASGVLYNESNIIKSKDFLQFIKRKIKGLWLPFFLFTSFFVIFNNIFIGLNILTDDSKILSVSESLYREVAEHYSFQQIFYKIINAVFFRTNTQLGGALWFLSTLFFVIIIFSLVDFLIFRFTKERKIHLIVQFAISVVFMLLGYYCSVNEISLSLGLDRVFSCYLLFFVGCFIKHFRLITRNIKIDICTISIAVVVLILSNHFIGSISLASNYYINPLYLIFMSIIGWYMLYAISDLLLFFKVNLLVKVLSYISMRSISILGLHFLCFKIVTVIGVMMNKYDNYLIASFPIYFHGPIWCLLYTFTGIAAPLLIDYVYLRIKKAIILCFKQKIIKNEV